MFYQITEGTTVSSGTLNPRDVMQACAWWLSECLEQEAIARDVPRLQAIDQGYINSIGDLFHILGTAQCAVSSHIGADDWFVSEEAGELMNELHDALDEFSGPGMGFGSHEGDGALIGWWPVEDFEPDTGHPANAPGYVANEDIPAFLRKQAN